MYPVRSREVKERQEYVLVLSQALHGSWILRLVFRDECVERFESCPASGIPDVPYDDSGKTSA